MADKTPPDRAYEKIPDAPKGWTLNDALKATVSPDGHYHCGQLEFLNKKEYGEFRSGQLGIGGTPQQLAILHQIESGGELPGKEPMNPAPAGTSVDKLLDVSDKKPDANGFYHLGTLRVKESEFKEFAELQKDLCAKNPEALAALYHMENAPDQPVTFRVEKNDRQDRYNPDANTIHWHAHTIARDSRNGARVDPETAALHEETHWALRGTLGDTLKAIPNEKYTDFNERAVIEGAEARQMDLVGQQKRVSHHGRVLNAREVDGIQPSVHIRQNGVEREVSAPFTQSGRVMGIKDGYVTLAVRGDGATPAHQMDIKIDDIQGAFRNDIPTTRVLLHGAETHNETVSISMTNDGRIVYQNPAQEKRLHDHPQTWPEFPKQMPAFGPDGAERPAQQPPAQRVEAPAR